MKKNVKLALKNKRDKHEQIAVHTHQASFEFHYKAVTAKLATEIGLFVNKSRELRGGAEVQGKGEVGFPVFIRDAVIAGVPAILLWIVAEQFDRNDYKDAAGILTFFASVILAAYFPVTALRHWTHPIKIWSFYGVFCIFLAFVFAHRR